MSPTEKLIPSAQDATGVSKEYSDYQKLLTEIEENHRRSQRTSYHFFGLMFVVVLVIIGISLSCIDSTFIKELQAGNASVTKNTDYLQIVIPILGAVGAAFIALLGMNRLKDMDAQVDQMRNSIQQELSKELTRVNQMRDSIQQDVEKELKRVNSLTGDISERMDVKLETHANKFTAKLEKEFSTQMLDSKERIEQDTNSALTAMDQARKDFDSAVQSAQEQRNAFDEKYKWLLSNKTATASLMQDVANVYDVHQHVETLWNYPEKPDNIVELTLKYVERVTSEDDPLRGDQNDFHNLAAELARHYFYQEACDVCRAGLNYFKDDIDLLSDWIQYGSRVGNLNDVETGPLIHLLKINKELWNWRAFDFTVDYYLAAKRFKEAEELAADFIEYLPYEERSYYSLAMVCLERYAKNDGMEKTISALQAALNKGINCPMCANKLADLLSDCGRLDEALVAANRAIQELSQEQPSVNYGYVVYRRALILDRLAFGQGECGQEYAEKAVLDYQIAINSGKLSYITRSQAKVRRDLLEKYFDIQVDEVANSNNSSDDISNEDFLKALMALSSKEDS